MLESWTISASPPLQRAQGHVILGSKALETHFPELEHPDSILKNLQKKYTYHFPIFSRLSWIFSKQ